MSITDEMILKYFTLAADADDVLLDQLKKTLMIHPTTPVMPSGSREEHWLRYVQ